MRKLHFNPMRSGTVPPDCVQTFLGSIENTADGQNQDALGQLRDDTLDPTALQRLCLHFANGVHYVSHAFRVAPARIRFVDYLDEEGNAATAEHLPSYDDAPHMASYVPDTQEVLVSRAWFRHMLLNPDERYPIGSQGQYHVSREDMAFLAGVHEAFHHAQEFGGSRAKRKGTLTHSLQDFDYENDPLENEAWKYELKVAREVGIVPKLRGHG